MSYTLNIMVAMQKEKSKRRRKWKKREEGRGKEEKSNMDLPTFLFSIMKITVVYMIA